MNVDLKPMEVLTIKNNIYIVQADPDPDMTHRPYVELGGSGWVVQLLLDNTKNYYALKIFNSPNIALVRNTKNLKRNNVHQLSGLVAAQRTVINPKENIYSQLIEKHSGLEYSVLMPWVGGYTWFEILGANRGETKFPLFDRETSLYFALQLARTLSSLETRGYAHCDICSNNIILDFKNSSVQLIDLEDMYIPGAVRSQEFIGGQVGYAHPNRPLGHQWIKSSDRFGGGILISEILSWHDSRIREASDAESYYSPSELCKDSKKVGLMKTTLRREGGEALAKLFDKMWNSKTLEDCPSLREWEQQVKIIAKNYGVTKPSVDKLSGFGEDGRIRIQRKHVPLTKKVEEAKPAITATRKKVVLTASPKSPTNTPLPTFQSNIDWLKVFGWILVIALIIGICIMISTATGGYLLISNPSSPNPVFSPVNFAPLIVSPSKTPRPTSVPSKTAKPTRTLDDSGFSSYSCLDKSQVRLRVGARAIVPNYDVNLRSSPRVPDVWDANIVVTLRKGAKMSVIGGPQCAHDGTWWEVQTDSGYTGWVRELQPGKILLEPIK